MRERGELRVAEQECDLGEIRVASLQILEREAAPRLLHEIAIREAALGEPALQRERPRHLLQQRASPDHHAIRGCRQRGLRLEVRLDEGSVAHHPELDAPALHRALEVESFADGRVQLRRLRIREPGELTGDTLAGLKLPHGLLVVAVARKDQFFVPGGDDRLEVDDQVYLIGRGPDLDQFELLAGAPKLGRRNVVLMGGSLGLAPLAPTPIISGPATTCDNPGIYTVTNGSAATQWIITGGTPATATGQSVNIKWNNSGPYIIEAVNSGNPANSCPSRARMVVRPCNGEDRCCNFSAASELDIKNDFVSNNQGGYTVSPKLTANANITKVTATIISASRLRKYLSVRQSFASSTAARFNWP